MSRIGNPSRRLLVVAVVALGMLLAAESVVLAATVTKNGGAVTAVRTVTNGDYFATTTISQTFVAVPAMSVTANVPTGQRGLLIITFFAVSQCIDDDTYTSTLCYIRVQVDGVSAPPGEVIFDSAGDGEDNALEANSMQFVSGPVSAGSHTVRVDWRVYGSHSVFGLSARTLTVLRSRVD
jgi:hypothetical protein